MPKRRIISLAALALLLTGIGAALTISTAEPSYAGRTLSSWISSFENQSIFNSNWAPTRHYDAEHAIQRLGSNATPYLIDWLAYSQPPWKSNVLYRANAIDKVSEEQTSSAMAKFPKLIALSSLLPRFNPCPTRTSTSLRISSFIAIHAFVTVPRRP